MEFAILLLSGPELKYSQVIMRHNTVDYGVIPLSFQGLLRLGFTIYCG